MTPETLKLKLQQLAGSEGFLAVGIARSRKLTEEEDRINQWLRSDFHGEMQYLKRNLEKRLDPGLLVENAKSVITFLLNYYPGNDQDTGTFKVARYARGKDYHKVIKDKIHSVVNQLILETGDFSYRIFVDSAPVMERQWAALAGLGWIGKNGLLLRQGTGSWFFIGTLITTLELPPDNPVTNHCGTCTACMDACPTQAFVADGVLDARKCISYQTIELKTGIEEMFAGKTEDWIYGCDICQEVCPWNRFAVTHEVPEFDALEDWLQWDKQTWQTMDETTFNRLFSHTAITRAGFEKLKSNIEFQH